MVLHYNFETVDLCPPIPLCNLSLSLSLFHIVPVEEVVRAEPGAEGDGLRQRHVLPPEPAMGRSSEDEDEEEEEFQLAERREEKKGFGLNKLIVAALVLLCLGSLFFSGPS